MTPQGRPEGEYRSAQHEGIAMTPQGRPKGEYRSAQYEGISMTPLGRLNDEAAPVTTGQGLSYGALGLPEFSDPSAPIHVHVAPRYLDEALAETGVPNIVTAVLASYRGYDTFGETTVVFTAGAGVVALLRRRRGDGRKGDRA